MNSNDYFEKNRTVYYDALQNVRIKNDLTGWIIFFLRAVIYTAKSAKHKFENAVKLNPKYEQPMQMIGTSYWFLGKWDMAYRYYKKTLEINPKNEEAIKWANDSYEKMKKNKEF